MGKARKLKSRKDPIGENAETASNIVLPIIKKLQSAEAGERSWAAASISNLVQESGARLELLKGGVIQQLIDMIASESSNEVQVEIAGCIRNLASFGGVEVCADFLLKGLSAKIIHLLPKIHNNIFEQVPDNSPDVLKTRFDLVEQMVNIIFIVCDSDENFLLEICRHDILFSTLFHIINPQVNSFTLNLVHDSLQCLSVFTEENPSVLKFFTPSSCAIISNLIHPESSESNGHTSDQTLKSLIQVISCSIAFNLRTHEYMNFKSIFQDIVSILSCSMDYDYAGAFSIVDQIKTNHIVNNELSKNGEMLLDRLSTQCTTLQLSLELLANIFASNVDNGSEWADNEMDDDHDEDVKDDMDMDAELMETIDAETGYISKTDESESAYDIFRVFAKQGVFEKIFRLVRIEMPQAQEFPAISLFFDAIFEVKIRAFACLQNIFTTADQQWYLDHLNEITSTWKELIELGMKFNSRELNDHDKEALCSLVSVLWAVSCSVQSFSKDFVNLKYGIGEISFIINVYLMPEILKEVKIHCLNILGLLGKWATTIEENKTIGEFLIQLITNEQSVEIVSEALNAIYDIYADKNFYYDAPVFVGLKFLDHLKELCPNFKIRVKSVDKRKLRNIRDRADEALINLTAFIKYKETE